ncbi:MAG: HD domain-containing protein [Christensenella sp.]|nr:HD domain-containing protein [Christensenella sp.]
MILKYPQYIQRMFVALEKEDIAPVYLVGGYVRNGILDLPPGDLDLSGSIAPQRFSQLKNKEIRDLKRVYGLGTIVLQQKFAGENYTYEYTAFRKDNYGRGGAHRPQSVVFTEDITEDALRRDFTINALYADAAGTVLDPTGRGICAIEGKKIEQVTTETLSQDALRILRMVRFACELGFSVEKTTYACAKRYVPQLADISAERIRDEFVKILLADAKYGNKDAVLRGLHMLHDLGAFPYIFPRLCDGDGVKQNPKYHAHDVMEHALRTCACAPPDIETRLAALLHDIGKPRALERFGKMAGHNTLGQEIAAEELQNLRFDKITVQNVGVLIREHMFDLTNQAGKKAVIRVITRLGEQQFLKLCDLREADFCGSCMGNVADSAVKWREMLHALKNANAPMRLKDLAVNGNDLQKELGIPAGRQIGELLSRLLAYAAKKPSQNNYKSLIRYAKIVTAQQSASSV